MRAEYNLNKKGRTENAEDSDDKRKEKGGKRKKEE